LTPPPPSNPPDSSFCCHGHTGKKLHLCILLIPFCWPGPSCAACVVVCAVMCVPVCVWLGVCLCECARARPCVHASVCISPRFVLVSKSIQDHRPGQDALASYAGLQVECAEEVVASQSLTVPSNCIYCSMHCCCLDPTEAEPQPVGRPAVATVGSYSGFFSIIISHVWHSDLNICCCKANWLQGLIQTNQQYQHHLSISQTSQFTLVWAKSFDSVGFLCSGRCA
jgi:hypothetical protein